jgi:hypothetical protein
MLRVETADVQLDGKAAVTEGLSVRLSQKLVEGVAQAVHRQCQLRFYSSCWIR